MWLIPLVGCALLFGGVWLLAERAECRRRWLRTMYGARCGMLPRIGFSLLAERVASLEQVEALLSVEYPDYEVVALVDSHTDESLFSTLVTRYSLIRVEFRLPSKGAMVVVRGLYRSRARRFRRLVVLDSPARGDCARLLAAEVASKSYLVRLDRGCCLLPDTIEMLALEIALCRSRRVDCVAAYPTLVGRVWQREVLLERGHFWLGRGVKQLLLWRPFVGRRLPTLRLRHALQLLWMVALLLPLFVGDERGWAMVATVAWCGVAVGRIAQLRRQATEPIRLF